MSKDLTIKTLVEIVMYKDMGPRYGYEPIEKIVSTPSPTHNYI